MPHMFGVQLAIAIQSAHIGKIIFKELFNATYACMVSNSHLQYRVVSLVRVYSKNSIMPHMFGVQLAFAIQSAHIGKIIFKELYNATYACMVSNSHLQYRVLSLVRVYSKNSIMPQILVSNLIIVISYWYTQGIEHSILRKCIIASPSFNLAGIGLKIDNVSVNNPKQL